MGSSSSSVSALCVSATKINLQFSFKQLRETLHGESSRQNLELVTKLSGNFVLTCGLDALVEEFSVVVSNPCLPYSPFTFTSSNFVIILNPPLSILTPLWICTSPPQK
mmetsp:Transcript_49946/g.57314  ORF Transcript_49946/g.57314 Transcript_49946/m.57314 type:complete len:108 (-) Transcript_49946:22-345(-)